MELSKISYVALNPRQQEVYNFHKVAAILADYGFTSIRLSDDWQGADFIAVHIDGVTTLRVQLKGRLTFAKKYLGKGLYIAFRYQEDWYLYPHVKCSKLSSRRRLTARHSRGASMACTMWDRWARS